MSYGMPYGNTTEKTVKTYDFGGAAFNANGANPKSIGADYSSAKFGGASASNGATSYRNRSDYGYPTPKRTVSTSGASKNASGRTGSDTKRRAVSRVPNMTSSQSGSKKIAAAGAANAVPVAGVHIEPNIKTVKDKKKKPLNIPAFIAGGLCTALFMYMLTNFVMINEYTKSITGLRNELSQLVEQERKLSLQLEKRNDLRVIEEMATKLGMVKVDQVSKQYVIIKSEDKIEILDDSQ